MVTLVLFARLEVTVTGPKMDTGLEFTDIGPEPWVMIAGPVLAVEVITETWPRAVLECCMDTDEVIGVRASMDLPVVRGFTEMD